MVVGSDTFRMGAICAIEEGVLEREFVCGIRADLKLQF